MKEEESYTAVELNTGGSRPKELFQVGAALLCRCSAETSSSIPTPSVDRHAFFPHFLHYFPSSPDLQDILEEMEGEYLKQRDALKAAVKERGLEVRWPGLAGGCTGVGWVLCG